MRVFLDTTYLLPVVGIEIDLPDCPITATALFDSDVMLTEAGDIPGAADFEVLNLKAFADRYL